MDVAKTENLGEHVSLVPSPPPHLLPVPMPIHVLFIDLPLVTAHFRDYYPVCVKSTIAVANVIIIELQQNIYSWSSRNDV